MKHIADFALHRSSTPNKRRQVESRLRSNCNPLRSHCVQTSFKFHCTPLQARSLSKKCSPGHGFRNGSITFRGIRNCFTTYHMFSPWHRPQKSHIFFRYDLWNFRIPLARSRADKLRKPMTKPSFGRAT